LYRSYDRNPENNEAQTSQLVALRLEDDFANNKEQDENTKSTCLFSLFLQSDNLNVRLLSCLIILRTLTQGMYINSCFL
jgi:hypothetical protein